MSENQLRNKKVLVTGGAGFIGSHLCEELVKLGAFVVSIDDYSAGKERNIDFLKDYHNFKALKKDICESDNMFEILDGVDTVFHNAASKKNVCLINPQKDLRVNGGGTLNLLDLSVKAKVRKFIHASTGSVYGEPVIFPTDEFHPLRPVSFYGVSKLAGERYVDVYHKLYGLNTTILRYFHVYGPRQEYNEFGGVVSIFLKKMIDNQPLEIFGDGQQVRSFTWVKDLVSANIEAATNPISSGEVYNAASGIRITIKELAEKLVDLFGNKTKIKYSAPLIGDIINFDVSNEKITSQLRIDFVKDFWGEMSTSMQAFVSYLEGK